MYSSLTKIKLNISEVMENKPFKSIVLLTDFSEPSRNAIRYAIDAFGENVEYNLVNSYFARTSSATLLDLNDMLAKESGQGLVEEKNWLQKTYPRLSLNIKTHSIFGTPVDAIKKLKNAGNYDMVLMGTKGASGIDAVLFGSVASTIIRATVIPVISVPPEFSFKGFHEVVLATDGKEISGSNTLIPIKKLQQQFESDITLFAVGKPNQKVDFSAMKVDVVNPHYKTVEGSNVVEEVTKFCNENNADLLAILPKHTGFFDRLFHKSVSKELVEQASLPILSLENEN